MNEPVKAAQTYSKALKLDPICEVSVIFIQY